MGKKKNRFWERRENSKLNSTSEKIKKGQRVAMTATVATIFLVLSKGAAGIIFDSRLLLADAFHSGVDCLAILAAWIGLKISSVKKSEKFPYGLFKAETLSVLIICIFIILGAVELIEDGVKSVMKHEKVTSFPLLPFSVSAISGFFSFFIARYEKKAGEEIGSDSLIANSRDSFLDVFASMVVCAGILLHGYNVPYVEGVIIIAIGLLIVKLGIENIYKSVLVLLDANLKTGLVSEIRNDIMMVPGVKSIGSLKIRSSGIADFAEVTIFVKRSVDVENAHHIADDIESYIVENYSHIDSVFVHIEPEDKHNEIIAVPVNEKGGMDALINPKFGKSIHFAIISRNGEDFKIETYCSGKYTSSKIFSGLNHAKMLCRYQVDAVIVRDIGEVAFHLFKNYRVEVYRTKSDSLNACLLEYKDKNIEKLESATKAGESY